MTGEMVSVPRDLLRHLRCDVLLAITELENPSGSPQDVIDLLRADRRELLVHAPYRFATDVQDSSTESFDVGESVKNT